MSARGITFALVILLAVSAGGAAGLYAGTQAGGWPPGYPPSQYVRLASGMAVSYLVPAAGPAVAGDAALAPDGLGPAVGYYARGLRVGLAAALLGAAMAFGVAYFALMALWPPQPLKRAKSEHESREALADQARVRLGKFALPIRVENRHTLAVGSTGTGKSQTIRAAVVAARARKNPAFVLDVGGELTSRLYRPDLDFIIAAHDVRSAPWSPLSELEGRHDAERVAAAMVPLAEGSGKEWTEYARVFVEGVLLALWQRHEAGEHITNADLVRYINATSMAQLREEIPDSHAAQGFLDDDNARMFSSVRATAAGTARGLGALDQAAGFDGWSIQQWLEDAENNGSWLFVPVPARTRDAGFPLASLVAGFFVDAVLSLSEDEARRVWFLCDELGQYPAVSALARAQTLGRKYGMACVHAVQSISQLRAAYGREGAQTLLSCYGNKMIYRCGDGDTAEWASKEIGDHQVRREVNSTSKGESSGGGPAGSSSYNESTSEQYSIERAVLPSEIQALPDLKAWLLTPASKGPLLSTVKYLDSIGDRRYAAFVPRKTKAKPAKPAAPADDQVRDKAAEARTDEAAENQERQQLDRSDLAKKLAKLHSSSR